MRRFLHWIGQTRTIRATRTSYAWISRSRFRQLVPLLIAVLALQIIFRFGLPYLWWDGHSVFHWWPGIGQFWRTDNQLDLMRQISINAILAFGMTLTILIGGIDLSVGALLALVGTITATILVEGQTCQLSVFGLILMKAQSPYWLVLAIAGGLGAAALLGLFNGLCAARTRMPPFIITLATMMIARGVAKRFNEGQPIDIPRSQQLLLDVGTGRLFGVLPIPVLIMAAIFLLAMFLLHRTRFGQHIYAMGGNREAARFTGIPLVRTEIAVYMLCSLLTAVAGMIHIAQLRSAEPASGEGFELNAIAAAVVGGTSFTGGKGTMIGTLIGAVIIGILAKGLNMAGVHHSYQNIVKGLVILGAVYVDVRRRK